MLIFFWSLYQGTLRGLCISTFFFCDQRKKTFSLFFFVFVSFEYLSKKRKSFYFGVIVTLLPILCFWCWVLFRSFRHYSPPPFCTYRKASRRCTTQRCSGRTTTIQSRQNRSFSVPCTQTTRDDLIYVSMERRSASILPLFFFTTWVAVGGRSIFFFH